MNKPARGLTISLLGLAVIGILLLSSASLARAEDLATWNSTTSYPTVSSPSPNGVEGNSCVVSSGYMYCVGGDAYPNPAPVDTVYSAPVSGSGVGTWTSQPPYPVDVYATSCVVLDSEIFCTGGNTGGGAVTNQVYSASVSSGTLGAWTLQTSTYGSGIENTSCVVSGTYITCIGGITYNSPQENTAAIYYTDVSGSSTGSWTATSNYFEAINGASCVSTGSVITCVGGQYNDAVSDDITDAVEYDTVSAGAVGGSWTTTSTYPLNSGNGVSDTSCNLDGGYIYCVAGYSMTGMVGVYYGPDSSGAVSSWSSGPDYPDAIPFPVCAAGGSYVYCVGGTTSDVYYAEITSTAPIITSSATSSSSSSSSSASSIPSSSATTTTSSSGTAVALGASVVVLFTAGALTLVLVMGKRSALRRSRR